MIKNHKLYRKLFNVFKSADYQLSDLEITNSQGEYPSNFLMHPSLLKKVGRYNNIMMFSWNINSHKKNRCSLLIYYDKRMSLNEKQIKTLIDSISFIVSFSKYDNNLIIHFSPLKDKKKIHKNQHNLSNLNINSGSCKGNEIFIYRYEECIKVLFHECIHYLDFSNQSMFSEDYLEYYKDKYNLNIQKINFNEAYTELFARLFYCYYLSNQSYHNFINLLSNEYQFSLFQANKILHFNEYTDVNRSTNTISYYLITCELLHNLHKLLQYFFQHNHQVFYLHNPESFKQLIFSLQKITKKRILKNQKNYSTMRMTISNHPFFP